MSSAKGYAWTFDTAVTAYEKFRPGYPKELYEAIFRNQPVTAASQVMEIGIGAGQATLPFLETGCRLTAVEFGQNFIRLCREKFAGFPGFSVSAGKFEELSFEPESYDLIVSATAFHWIPEETGYPKVFSLLKDGGVFARFANRPLADKGRPKLTEEIQALYAVYMGRTGSPEEFTEADAARLAKKALDYGFSDVQYGLFHRTRTFSAKEYTALLGTYSDHLAIEEKKRNEFFSEIEHAIDRHGGEITIYDTIDLQLARKGTPQ